MIEIDCGIKKALDTASRTHVALIVSLLVIYVGALAITVIGIMIVVVVPVQKPTI